MSYLNDTNTMNELYQSNFERRASLKKSNSDENQENNSSDNEVYDDTNNNTMKLLNLIFWPISFLFRILVSEPSVEMHPKSHFFIGIFKSVLYAFGLYNVSNVKSYVSQTGISDEMITVIMALFVVWSIVQTFYGIFIMGGTFADEQVFANNSYSYGSGVVLTKSDKAIIKDAVAKNKAEAKMKSNSPEFSETMRYIDRKMGGMSNSQKEKYLSKLYGGKLK